MIVSEKAQNKNTLHQLSVLPSSDMKIFDASTNFVNARNTFALIQPSFRTRQLLYLVNVEL